ncbi:MAG: choice-of-anchor D domain-containing protein [Deltaproteobacteria bacterium]|nr:choice-of-anchor D domain-containing protein [Deltaproteobacteria bacterium]
MTKTGLFRGVAAALLAVLVGCGGDSGTGKITVTVDGNGLPPDKLASITTICIRVEGDLEQVETCFPVPPGSFDDGNYQFDYTPKNVSGVLRIIVTAKDADGNVVAANTVDAEIIPGKVTPATVTLSGLAATPLIVLEPATVDYGALVLGAAAGRQTVTVRNAGGAIAGPLASTLTGDAAVFVLDATTSCDGRMLAPAESCMMTLEFRPTEAGVRSARLEVTATPGGVVSATLTGSAMTPAELAISPDTASLGDVEVGQAGGPVTITVTNNGGVASGALAATIAGSSSAEVSLGADTCSGVALAPAATCTVALTLRPTSAGVKAAMLTVTGTPGGSVVTMLAGRGLTPAALGLTPTSQDFGTTVTGAQAEATFTVRNGGEVATGMVTVALGGASASEFALPTDNCSGAPLAPAATCTVTVRFAPTTAGAKTATLRVRATPGGDITATLAGNAVPPGVLSLAPASADFGGVVVGASSSTLTFTATNTGGAATGLITVALGGTSADQFTKLTDTCSATSVPAAGTCTVSYQMRPTTAGGKNASLVISSTPGGTATAALSGAGLAPALLSASASSVALGTVDVGFLSLPFTWTITNVGGVPTGVVATALTGNTADFTVGGNCNTALAPNQSCQLTVTLSPASGGAKSLTVTVSGTPGGSVQLVASGTARPPQMLTVTRMGNGMNSGTVTATGISCGADCSEGYRYGTVVTLTASVSTGTGFTGWSGACTGTGACVVTMNQAQSVVATFTLTKVNLSVSTSGTTTGSVTSAPAGISCGTDCAELYDYGTPVVLTARPATNYSFGGWSGACGGLTTTCSVNMTVARNVTAIFTLNTSALNVSLVGGGRVTSTPAGIDCGSDCGEAYTTGTVVQLSASASTGYSFGGWTVSAGTCTGTTTPCSVTMSVARSLTATFNPIPVVLMVGRGGKGSGTVASSPGTINCGTTCSNTFNYGTPVTLTATPDVGNRISGWTGGGCAGTGTTCVVTPTAATTVRVDFEKLIFTLDVTRSGAAASKGLVTDPASSGRINCGTDCSDTWSYGDVVTLTANANGNIFAGWSYGTCGTALTCAVTITGNITVNARFEIPVGITVRLAGSIPGNISSSPTGISCNYPASGTCSAAFTSNSTVRLTAKPATNYGFLSWDSRGACAASGSDPVCYIRLGTAAEVAIGTFYTP